MKCIIPFLVLECDCSESGEHSPGTLCVILCAAPRQGPSHAVETHTPPTHTDDMLLPPLEFFCALPLITLHFLTHQCVLHLIGPKTSPSNPCCLRCPASPWTPSSRAASGFSKRSMLISTGPAAAPAAGWRWWPILALARPPSSPALWHSAATAPG